MKHIKLTKKTYLIMTPILVIKIFGDILGDYVRTILELPHLKHQNSLIGNPRDKAEIFSFTQCLLIRICLTYLNVLIHNSYLMYLSLQMA